MAKKKKYSNILESPGFVLWRVSNTWQKKFSQVLESIDLTYVEFVLLMGLDRFSKKNQEVTQTQLATETNTDVMMTSQVLRKLEARGYVKRKDHETDSRAKKIQLTKKGLDAVEESTKLLENLDMEFFEKTSKDTEKLIFGLTEILNPE